MFGSFKQMPALTDPFTGWIEALPTSLEEATKVSKVLLREITPRFGPPQSLQNDKELLLPPR